MRPRRPLRSVILHNPRYLSGYVVGVNQACCLLGHTVRQVSIWEEAGSIEKQIQEAKPDVIWTHCTLWPPKGALQLHADETSDRAAVILSEILGRWKRRGTAVFLHDGDPKGARRIDSNLVSGAYSIALCNRCVLNGDGWAEIPSIQWPYAAMVQKEIGEPLSEWACDLLFSGHIRTGDVYGPRTELVFTLQQRLGARMRIVSPGGGDTNNRLLAPETAPSAGAVLGFGRPEIRGWIDTRVFQYPGAGGVLIHDDAGDFLEPDVHYLRVERGNVDAILAAVERAKAEGPAMRERAFRHVQANHTWIHRVESALAAFFGAG